MSLMTVERTTDLFWQTAGEGGLEAPLQCILQIYKVLVTGQQERVPQFMLSIITSLFSTANSFGKLDKYGNGLSVLSWEHARQVCWRILWLAPRLLGLPIFAYLTRPHHVGLHENKQVVVFVYAALELFLTWQIVIRRSSVRYVLGVQLFFAALTMMAVPPVMLPSVRRKLPVYATQRPMSFFVMAQLGMSMSPINSAHTQLLLQPPAVFILAVFILTFMSWLVAAINILVQECCHRDANGREDDYALLGIEPGAKFERERQERQLAVALREAVASGDEILTTFLLQEGASVDGKHDPGVGVLELDLWRGQKFAEAVR
ncbi:Ripk4 [Symbiodinium sp. CCMP2456]|nr:Ripk4 [Symbiodinium sp. CCMP2456]